MSSLWGTRKYFFCVFIHSPHVINQKEIRARKTPFATVNLHWNFLRRIMFGPMPPALYSVWMASSSTPPGIIRHPPASEQISALGTGGCLGDAEGRNAFENCMDHRAGFLSAVHLLAAEAASAPRWARAPARRCHLWPPGLFLPGIPLGAQQQGHPILLFLSLSFTHNLCTQSPSRPFVPTGETLLFLSITQSWLIAFSA